MANNINNQTDHLIMVFDYKRETLKGAYSGTSGAYPYNFDFNDNVFNPSPTPSGMAEEGTVQAESCYMDDIEYTYDKHGLPKKLTFIADSAHCKMNISAGDVVQLFTLGKAFIPCGGGFESPIRFYPRFIGEVTLLPSVCDFSGQPNQYCVEGLSRKLSKTNTGRNHQYPPETDIAFIFDQEIRGAIDNNLLCEGIHYPEYGNGSSSAIPTGVLTTGFVNPSSLSLGEFFDVLINLLREDDLDYCYGVLPNGEFSFFEKPIYEQNININGDIGTTFVFRQQQANEICNSVVWNLASNLDCSNNIATGLAISQQTNDVRTYTSVDEECIEQYGVRSTTCTAPSEYGIASPIKPVTSDDIYLASGTHIASFNGNNSIALDMSLVNDANNVTYNVFESDNGILEICCKLPDGIEWDCILGVKVNFNTDDTSPDIEGYAAGIYRFNPNFLPNNICNIAGASGFTNPFSPPYEEGNPEYENVIIWGDRALQGTGLTNNDEICLSILTVDEFTNTVDAVLNIESFQVLQLDKNLLNALAAQKYKKPFLNSMEICVKQELICTPTTISVTLQNRANDNTCAIPIPLECQFFDVEVCETKHVCSTSRGAWTCYTVGETSIFSDNQTGARVREVTNNSTNNAVNSTLIRGF